MLGGHAQDLHETGHLLGLVFAWEQGHARPQLRNDAPERPHVDRRGLGKPQNHVWGSLESTLNISLHSFVHETTAAEVDHLKTRLFGILQQYIFWFKIAMDHIEARILTQGIE